MLKIKQYVKAESLEQAYELNQKKTNRIVGGMLWLKMSTAQIQTAIDLSGLGLDQIEETEDAWKIGCMVSLRDLELHEGLNELSCNMIRESVRVLSVYSSGILRRSAEVFSDGLDFRMY